MANKRNTERERERIHSQQWDNMREQSSKIVRIYVNLFLSQYVHINRASAAVVYALSIYFISCWWLLLFQRWHKMKCDCRVCTLAVYCIQSDRNIQWIDTIFFVISFAIVSLLWSDINHLGIWCDWHFCIHYQQRWQRKKKIEEKNTHNKLSTRGNQYTFASVRMLIVWYTEYTLLFWHCSKYFIFIVINVWSCTRKCQIRNERSVAIYW